MIELTVAASQKKEAAAFSGDEEAAGMFMSCNTQDSLECSLFSAYAAVCYQIECESESSCVIAGCLFPFVSTSVSW